jgi:hypothetical protein
MTTELRSAWGTVASLGTLLLCGIWAGCGESDATAEAPDPVGVGVPQAAGGDRGFPEQGCTTTTRAADANGCRGEWICADTLARTLLCLATEDGIVCSCGESSGDEDIGVASGGSDGARAPEGVGAAGAGGAADAVPVPLSSTATCVTPEEVSAVASSLCRWDVP